MALVVVGTRIERALTGHCGLVWPRTYNLSKYLDYSIMEYISNTNGLIQMWNIFAARSAKDFAVNGDGNSYGFQSVFYLGMPIDGYADDKDSPSDQVRRGPTSPMREKLWKDASSRMQVNS